MRAILRGCLAAIFVAASLNAQEVRDTAGPLEKQALPASADNPIPRKAVSAAAIYPPEASGFGANGRVGVDGKVADAKVLRGIPLLDQAALDAVRQWEYTRIPDP